MTNVGNVTALPVVDLRAGPGQLRDHLRDAFHVVKRLREMVRRHFNLAMF